MYQVIVQGADMLELVANMSAFIAGIAGSKPAKASKAKTPAATPEPAPMTDPPASEQDAKVSDEPEKLTEEDLKEYQTFKENALGRLRDLFATGADGQKAVNAIAKKFGVKKLGDVPVERAAELLEAVLEVSPAK